MSLAFLDDPAAMAATDTIAGRYAAAFAGRGAGFIANACSKVCAIQADEHVLPVTIDDGGTGRSYVASPHSAYVDYARREMDLVGMRRGRAAAAAALSVLDRVLRAARINRAVHIDNWLLATNLHGAWRGQHLRAIRESLQTRFPDHFLVMRSLDSWSCPGLLEAARDDGWLLVPARQIWVVDDLERDWRGRNNHGNDRRALARSGLEISEPSTLSAADCDRIAELYRLLYLEKYCALNPAFTGAFVSLLLETGFAAFRVARSADGTIMAVAGMIVRDGVTTPAVVGYDTSRPPEEALYRIASYLFADWAMEHGYRLHGSAGAADFKRRRGARGVIEYMAVQADHLATPRRAAIRALAAGLETFLVPMMRREGW